VNVKVLSYPVFYGIQKSIALFERSQALSLYW